MFMTYECDGVRERLLDEHITSNHSIIVLEFVILQSLPITVVTIDSTSTKSNIISESGISYS